MKTAKSAETILSVNIIHHPAFDKELQDAFGLTPEESPHFEIISDWFRGGMSSTLSFSPSDQIVGGGIRKVTFYRMKLGEFSTMEVVYRKSSEGVELLGSDIFDGDCF